MKRHYVALVLAASGLALLPVVAREPLAARIAHSDPARYRHSPAVHGGAGSMDFTALFDAHTLEPNLQFLHRGVIQPKSGIGAHFHNQCEEMFVIFDGQHDHPFTVAGDTDLLGLRPVPDVLRHVRDRGRLSHLRGHLRRDALRRLRPTEHHGRVAEAGVPAVHADWGAVVR